MTEIFVYFLAVAIAASIIIYGIGHVIVTMIHFHASGTFTRVFIKFFAGCFSSTAICALYFTSLKTIFLGTSISCIYFFFWYRKYNAKKPIQFTPYRKELAVVLLFLVVLSAIYSYRFYSASYNGNSILNIPNSDFTFYARISHFIRTTGVESATPSLVYLEQNTRDPYHYFDIWFPSLISAFVGNKDLQVLFLVSYTMGITMVWLGFCAIAETLKKLSALNILFALLATFFLPLQSFFSEFINTNVNTFFLLTHAPPDYLAYGLWNMSKMYPVYLVFIAAILALIKNEKAIAIAILSVLPFIYTTIAIPITIALSFYILFDFIYISKEKKFFIGTSVFLALVYLFIFAFYLPYLTDSVGVQLDPFRRIGVEPLYKSILRPVKIFVDTTLQVIILVFPFVVLLFLELRSKRQLRTLPSEFLKNLRNKPYVQLALILYCASLISWCILFDIVDANQFFVKTAIVMINILCFFVLVNLSKPLLKLLAFVLAIYFINITTKDIFEQRLYSEDFAKKVQEETKSTERIIGFMLGAADYKDGFGDNIVDVLGDHITLFRPDSYFVNLTITDWPLPEEKMESDSMKQYLSQHDFYQFITNQKKLSSFHNIAQSRIDFIDEYKVDCIMASSHVALDSLLVKRISKAVQDPYSGQQFLLLRNKD